MPGASWTEDVRAVTPLPGERERPLLLGSCPLACHAQLVPGLLGRRVLLPECGARLADRQRREDGVAALLATAQLPALRETAR